MFWQYIPPPWTQDKPITLSKGVTPMGARFTDLRTPDETIQMIGKAGAPVPETISVDKGVVDILVTEGGKRIAFSGGGLATNVGLSIDSNVVGMSLSGVDADTIMRPLRGVNRIAAKKKAPRRIRRDDDFSDLTSVRGIRY